MSKELDELRKWGVMHSSYGGILPLDHIEHLEAENKMLSRALFLACRWTVEGQPLSAQSCEGGMGHFIELAKKELQTV